MKKTSRTTLEVKSNHVSLQSADDSFLHSYLIKAKLFKNLFSVKRYPCYSLLALPGFTVHKGLTAKT